MSHDSERTDAPTDERTSGRTGARSCERTGDSSGGDADRHARAGDALVVNDYDGDPAWSANRNDLGEWCGAGSFANGSGEVEDGALVLEYDNGGWFQEQINRDVSDYDTLVLQVRGANGGEESEVRFSMGGASGMLAGVTDDSVGTSFSELAVDMEGGRRPDVVEPLATAQLLAGRQ